MKCAGDPVEWPEQSGMIRSIDGRSSPSKDERLSDLKTFLTGAARRSVQSFDHSDFMFNAARRTFERMFGQPRLSISAQLSRLQPNPTINHQDSEKNLVILLILIQLLGDYFYNLDTATTYSRHAL